MQTRVGGLPREDLRFLAVLWSRPIETEEAVYLSYNVLVPINSTIPHYYMYKIVMPDKYFSKNEIVTPEYYILFSGNRVYLNKDDVSYSGDRIDKYVVGFNRRVL